MILLLAIVRILSTIKVEIKNTTFMTNCNNNNKIGNDRKLIIIIIIIIMLLRLLLTTVSIINSIGVEIKILLLWLTIVIIQNNNDNSIINNTIHNDHNNSDITINSGTKIILESNHKNTLFIILYFTLKILFSYFPCRGSNSFDRVNVNTLIVLRIIFRSLYLRFLEMD